MTSQITLSDTSESIQGEYWWIIDDQLRKIEVHKEELKITTDQIVLGIWE